MTFERMHVVAALVLAGSLGGCMASDPFGDQAADALSTRQPVQPMTAWASLPASAGTPLRVIEETHPTSRLQRAAYPGGGTAVGENSLSVELEGPGGARPDLRHPPTEAMIAEELNAAAPGTAWQRGSAQLANAYGPFGYAEGASGNTTCVYAWQWFDRSAMSGEGQGLVKKLHPVSIRMRMCDEIAANELLDRMKGLRLSFVGLSAPLVGYSAPLGGDALAQAGGVLGVAAGTPALGYEAEPAAEAPAPVKRRAPAPSVAKAVTSAAPVVATAPVDGPVIPTVASITGSASAASSVPSPAENAGSQPATAEADSGPRIPVPSAM